MHKRKRTFAYAMVFGGAQVLAAVVFLACAWGIAYLAADNELLVPSLKDCLEKAGKLLLDSWFWQSFFATLWRVLGAWALAFCLAAVLAVAAYLVPAIARFLTPIMAIIRSLPVLAVALILLVWWGAGSAPIAVAFLSLFPMLYVGVLAALSGVDKDLIEMSKAYRVPLRKQILTLYVPSASPYVLKEAGAALSFALKLVVSAEVLVNTYKGLGGMMGEARIYDMPTLFALVILSFVTALILEGLAALAAGALERRVR